MRIFWIIENKLIGIQSPERLSRADILKMNADIIALLDTSTQAPVHTLFFSQQLKEFPSNIYWLKQNFTCVAHPRSGKAVSITDNWLVIYAGRLAFKLLGAHAPLIVRSYDEACECFAWIDPALSHLPYRNEIETLLTI